MKLSDLQNFIMENCHIPLRMDENGYDLQIVDNIFSGGWDYFLLTDEEGVTLFPKIIIESGTNTYMTCPVALKDGCESLYEWVVNYGTINICEEKVLKYIKLFEMEFKKTKENVRLNEVQKDFE